MSGGSFDYLCGKDTESLMGMDEQLQAMEEELRSLGYDDVADETKTVREMIEKFKSDVEQKLEELSKVWKAVEWYTSNDWSKEQVEAAVGDFRLHNQQGK